MLPDSQVIICKKYLKKKEKTLKMLAAKCSSNVKRFNKIVRDILKLLATLLT